MHSPLLCPAQAGTGTRHGRRIARRACLTLSGTVRRSGTERPRHAPRTQCRTDVAMLRVRQRPISSEPQRSGAFGCIVWHAIHRCGAVLVTITQHGSAGCPHASAMRGGRHGRRIIARCVWCRATRGGGGAHAGLRSRVARERGTRTHAHSPHGAGTTWVMHTTARRPSRAAALGVIAVPTAMHACRATQRHRTVASTRRAIAASGRIMPYDGLSDGTTTDWSARWQRRRPSPWQEPP
jgi:hypothetical protein